MATGLSHGGELLCACSDAPPRPQQRPVVAPWARPAIQGGRLAMLSKTPPSPYAPFSLQAAALRCDMPEVGNLALALERLDAWQGRFKALAGMRAPLGELEELLADSEALPALMPEADALRVGGGVGGCHRDACQPYRWQPGNAARFGQDSLVIEYIPESGMSLNRPALWTPYIAGCCHSVQG